ncbi:MAG: sodium:calcium antiporter [Bacteroidales bacterium]
MELIHSVFNSFWGGLLLMVICSIIIAKACDIFEASTDYLGRNLSDGVKGATLNAIASSMPELLTTAFFLILASKEELGRGLAAGIGGNTGSAIFNSIVIPILVILVVILSGKGIKEIKIDKKVVLRDGLFLIVGEVLLIVLVSDDVISQWHGWAFTLFYIIYLAYTLFTMKKTPGNNENGIIEGDQQQSSWFLKYLYSKKSRRGLRSWNLLIIATLIIAVACAGLVEGCNGISYSLGINPLIIALVLVAAASSVPDAIISMKDARKGNYEDAISNVLGSNIFDISISMGLPLAIFLLVTDQEIYFGEAGASLIDIRIILLAVTIISVGIFYFAKSLTKRHALYLTILYVVFILYSIGSASFSAGGDNVLAQGVKAIKEFLMAV